MYAVEEQPLIDPPDEPDLSYSQHRFQQGPVTALEDASNIASQLKNAFATLDLNQAPAPRPPSDGLIEHWKSQLMSLVAVNSIADYYDVPMLLDSINNQIHSFFQDHWSPKMFMDVAKALPSLTGDKHLHHLFAFHAAQHTDDLAQHGASLNDLMTLQDFPELFMLHYEHNSGSL